MKLIRAFSIWLFKKTHALDINNANVYAKDFRRAENNAHANHMQGFISAYRGRADGAEAVLEILNLKKET